MIRRCSEGGLSSSIEKARYLQVALRYDLVRSYGSLQVRIICEDHAVESSILPAALSDFMQRRA
ncbi:MAG: hypothetical protein QY326_06875 [Bdellovibrionota bacterium]|nr:MAG: hypothetical protein QY326_06875 [Bdellovibrionota bacterium]